MNINEILELDVNKQIELLKGDENPNYTKWQQQYTGDHDIKRDSSRKPYSVERNGRKELVKPAVIILKLQKKIVDFARYFLFGQPVQLKLNNKDDEKAGEAFELLKQEARDNKLQYFDRELCKVVKTEGKAAEIWLPKTDGEKTTGIRVVLLSRSRGDQIWANWNDEDDLDAICREYEVDVLKNGSKETETRFEIFTAEKMYRYVMNSNTWENATFTTESGVEKEYPKPNPIGKINAVWYEQDEPDWADVQGLIDRLEMVFSKLADSNDYYSSPILQMWGKLKGDMPAKERDAKILQFEQFIDEATGKEVKGGAEFLEMSQLPESKKLEIENLLKQIHYITATPDISFENVKGIGNVSGIALKLMFIDALGKAKDSEKIFGEGWRRRTKVMAAFLGVIYPDMKQEFDELDVTPEMQNPLPENVKEMIEWLSTARSGEKLISLETAVEHVPGVTNDAEEVERIREESVSTFADSVRF